MIVIYTDKFIPKRFGAINLWFITLIRPKHRGERDLLEHEREHMRQINRYLILQPILYHLSRRWRLKFEAEAYRVSIIHGMSLELAVYYLTENYDLDITSSEAHAAILEARNPFTR